MHITNPTQIIYCSKDSQFCTAGLANCTHCSAT